MISDPPIHSRSFGQTETGQVRANNQDAILVDEAAGLWLVADGMGGHAGGAEASHLARTTVRAALNQGSSLRSAILAAHAAIRAEQALRPELTDMGTTIVAALEQDDHYEIGWVGDSRAYLFDLSTQQLCLLTRDHNLAGLMVEAGAISASEAAHHPKRHVLTDCLGLHSDGEPRVDMVKERWQANQILLLCSDGLSGELSDQTMATMLALDQSLAALGERLMSAALEAGAKDNVSLILVRSPLDGKPAGSSGARRRWLGRA
ncbi:serine/threonine-protein phosphatase [Wenzhouxiangella sp. C33]|uniref:Serine/threonine-protein phosphatase n=2 Tax=Wenzhouxiangella limi TaxID=2707351 RepID=A0A845V2E6_9GAMM|nr:serine/threonine-protein phosphatase [Wenzhouxiangella limi]